MKSMTSFNRYATIMAIRRTILRRSSRVHSARMKYYRIVGLPKMVCSSCEYIMHNLQKAVKLSRVRALFLI